MSTRPFVIGFLPMLLLTAAFLTGCQGSGLSEEREKEVDEETRQENSETAAFTYYDGGAYQKSEAMFERALEKKPKDKKLRRGLARCKIMLGTPQKLREAEKLLIPLMDMEWRHTDLGDRKFEVVSDMATVYTDLADHYDRDIRELENRGRNDPDADKARIRRQVQKQVSARNELLGDAIPLWRQVLNASPRNQYALAGLAKANLQLSRDQEGIEYATEYLELAKDSQQNWKDQMKNFEKARGSDVTSRQRAVIRRKILGAREKQKLMHFMLASVHMRRQDYREAVDQYSRAIHLDKDMTNAYLERAQALAAVGRHPLAVNDLRDYMRRTSPETHRGERVQAAELLQKYRKIVREGETREVSTPIRVSEPRVTPPSSTESWPSPSSGSPSSGGGNLPTPVYDEPDANGFPR